MAVGERIGNSILTESLVRKIKTLHVPNKFGARRIARVLEIPWYCAQWVLIGRTWKHVK